MFTTASNSISTTVVAALGTALFAGVCLFGATAPAAAAPAPHAQTVSYSDLNVASTSGRKTLDRRIVHAARNVCETGADTVRARDMEARCIDQAVSDARSQVYSFSASTN